ncbi:MAG: hypothetical protein KGM99_00490 [Burkholderiales bacterium]|nr:hypothetical protein [Burkholderiales bacterium]
MRALLKTMFFLSLLLLALALWRRDNLPAPNELDPVLLNEPVQTQITESAFHTHVKGVDYKVQPLYDYDLVGLVVSKHNANTWWDYIHQEWNDHLNIVDLCVVWGNNVRTGAYREISFSSGQFTCNFSTRSSAAFAAFDQTAISNNHLLSDQRSIANILRDVHIGDQIHFRGRLSEYSHNDGFPFKRGTSTVRTDTGNGACETVFIDSVEILHRGGQLWRLVIWLAALMLLCSMIALLSMPVKFND